MPSSSPSGGNCTLLLANQRSLPQDQAWPPWAPQCACLTARTSWQCRSCWRLRRAALALCGYGAWLRLCSLALP